MVGMLATIAACSAKTLLNLSVPRDGYRVAYDVAYGKDARQKMDIYIPAKPKKDAPVVLFFYGGSWQFGSKDDYRFLGQALTSRGITVAVADYRLYPEVYFPAFVEDGAEALAFLHKNAANYGANPERIYLAGHSAGAYIAVMLTVNDAYLPKAGAQKEWIKGTIGIAGPYDFLPLTDKKLIDLFSTASPALTQPITFILEKQPPMLLVTGADDEDVGPHNTRNVAEKLEALQSPVTTHYYKDTGHIGIILSLARGFRGRTPLLDDIDAFVY